MTIQNTTIITYQDILRARSEGPAKLNEVSLGRVYQHVQQSGVKSYGILTSWVTKADDGTVPEEERKQRKTTNNKRFADLKSDMSSAKLGYSKLMGHWTYEDGNTGTEPTLFVTGISKEQIKDLGKKYNQEAVIYAGPDTDGNVTLIMKDGTETSLGKFHAGKIASNWSVVRGRPFVFEGFEQGPEGWIQHMMQDANSKQTLRELISTLRDRTDKLK